MVDKCQTETPQKFRAVSKITYNLLYVEPLLRLCQPETHNNTPQKHIYLSTNICQIYLKTLGYLYNLEISEK